MPLGSLVLKWSRSQIFLNSPLILQGNFNLSCKKKICKKEWFLAHLSRRLEWAIVIARRPSVRPSSGVRKLFTFSTSSPEPLDGFWWNLVGMKYSWSLTQGGHRLWKTGKMMKKNSLCGKIREFDKNKKIREKSGNFTIPVSINWLLVVSLFSFSLKSWI